ncbi:DUF3307 domain-containing protein [Cyanobium sp. NS01]|uniref:DUF3307 domain-containing protein n=1 Tax=Cyanobium sp. NS01 TaxID=261284 RepID=UPI0018610B04|nr:DUF3307 domain-containing protein [Cyanobium sp. NS01]QNI71881.1 bacteriophage-like DUF3307 domain-containing protein [Cyanobium sp. NS01]
MADLQAGLDLFLLLAMGHFLGDFALQSDRMALEKCPGVRGVLPWGWWLVAHAGIHGFLVAVITGVPLLGLAEWILHAGIDLGKCRRLYSIGIDQMLHLGCKLLWVAVLLLR